MSLTTYSELQTAVYTELDKENLSAYIPDFIKRAEAKINRRARFREMEQQSYTDYDATVTTRRVTLPSDFIEMLVLKVKKATEEDSAYQLLTYVGPSRLSEYYYDSSLSHYTLRTDIEFNTTVSETHRVLMDYYKRLDIATDLSNAVLTNHPDIYLYGACAEMEMFDRNDPRVPMWKGLFDAAIDEANEREERSRDDAMLSTSDVACLGGNGTFNILRG